MVNRTTKNKILKALGYLNLAAFLQSACMIDAYSWTPTIVCVVTGGYLALFAYANNWFNDWRY